MKNSLPYFFFCLDYLIKIGFVHYELAFDLFWGWGQGCGLSSNMKSETLAI